MNTPCDYDFGEWVTDSLGKVLQEGYTMGSFYRNDMPFGANKLSGLIAKTWNFSKVISIEESPYSVDMGIHAKFLP